MKEQIQKMIPGGGHIEETAIQKEGRIQYRPDHVIEMIDKYLPAFEMRVGKNRRTIVEVKVSGECGDIDQAGDQQYEEQQFALKMRREVHGGGKVTLLPRLSTQRGVTHMWRQRFSRWVTAGLSSIRPSVGDRSSGRFIIVSLLSVTLLLTLLNDPARAAGPCTCKDLDKIKENLDRAATSEEIWKYIFAWARETYRDVDLPKTNDDLNQKFVQLKNAPSSRWYDLIKEGPVKEKKSLKKIAGLSEKGEPVVDEDFQNSNCDDIIEAEKEHERKHKEFYLSFPQVFDVVMTSRLQRLRAESEVESYRAQKTFLEKKYADLKLKCLPKEDPSIKQQLRNDVAQRERLNQAENRIRMLGGVQNGK